MASAVITDSFNALAREAHEIARAQGWWDEPRGDAELLALIHSEVSEAFAGIQAGDPPDDKIPEFKSSEAELADVIIRIMDLAQARGWRVGAAYASLRAKSYWSAPDSWGLGLLNIHCQISAALEALRRLEPASRDGGKFMEVEQALARAVLETYDLARVMKLSLLEAVIAKIKYNRTRPYRHGKKF